MTAMFKSITPITWIALLAAAALTARDSLAGPDAGADAGATSGRPVIPPRVEKGELSAFDAEPFPEEKSKSPKPAEWKEAKEVKLTRVSRRVTGCAAYRVREWVKIRCERMTGGARLTAGSAEGIEMVLPEEGEPDRLQLARSFEIVFPVRRGDRRVFETFDFEFGEWEGFGTGPGLLIEEQWLEGAAKPTIALLRS